MSSSRSRKGVKLLLRIWLAKLSYELTIRWEKHDLRSLTITEAWLTTSYGSFTAWRINTVMMWSGIILSILLFKYFSLLSDTICSENSVEFMKKKPEFIQNYGRTDHFLVICNKRPVKVEILNHAVFVITTKLCYLLKTRRNGTPVFTLNSLKEKVSDKLKCPG